MRKLMLMLVVLVFVGSAFAAPAEPYRLAFLTEGTYQAVDTDIAVYNGWMQDEADGAGIGMGGTYGDLLWYVVGSTADVDARDNTGTNPDVSAGVPIYLLDGTTMIAGGNADLWDGTIAAAINQTPFGGGNHNWVFAGTSRTGVASGGGIAGPIEGGAYGDPLGGPGQVNQGSGADPTGQWICPVDGGYIMDAPTEWLPMYAISGVIPEPATMCLLGLGGLAMLRRRR